MLRDRKVVLAVAVGVCGTGGLLLLAGLQAQSAPKAPIAFVSTQNGNTDIYSMDVRGQDVRRLTDDPKRDEAPTWSSDSRGLLVRPGRHVPTLR